jgi:hypothetical protein
MTAAGRPSVRERLAAMNLDPELHAARHRADVLELETARLQRQVAMLEEYLDTATEHYGRLFDIYVDTAVRADAGRRVVRERRRGRLKKARILRSGGYSVAQIAQRLATDEGRAAPFPKRTVERWLAATKP